MPSDLPSIEMTNHLLPLTMPGGLKLYFENGTVNQYGYGEPGQAWVRANRARLRQWLATNIDVQWGKHMTRIEETEAAVTLHFEDGTSATGDVLVGADGINSRGTTPPTPSSADADRRQCVGTSSTTRPCRPRFPQCRSWADWWWTRSRWSASWSSAARGL